MPLLPTVKVLNHWNVKEVLILDYFRLLELSLPQGSYVICFHVYHSGFQPSLYFGPWRLFFLLTSSFMHFLTFFFSLKILPAFLSVHHLNIFRLFSVPDC